MLRIPIALIGVNFTENENVFLGSIIKVNEVNDILLLVDNSELFTQRVNDVIKDIEKLYKKSKTPADFFEMVKYITNAKLMFYDRLIPIHNDAADTKMIINQVKSLYMNVFSNIRMVDKRVDKDEQARVDSVKADKEEKASKKQLKNKEDNK